MQLIAQSLKNAIGPAARVNQYLDLYALEIDPITGLPIKDTIQRRGVQSYGYQETGFQLRGYAMVDGAGNQYYEDGDRTRTTENTGKPLFVIDQSSNPLAQPLFLDGLGRLTTTTPGAQALRIIEGNRLPMAFYRNSDGRISNWNQGTRLTSATPIAPGVSPVRALYFDSNGNKAVGVPYVHAAGVEQKGYQEQGYQVWGYYYYPSSGVKSTTAIGPGYVVIEDFDDPKSVPLYVRINVDGITEINTERIANESFTIGDPGTDEAYDLFFQKNKDYESGDLYQKYGTLFKHKDENNKWVVTDDPFDGIRPYLRTYALGNAPGGSIIDNDIPAHTAQPLYIDANGNLTTQSEATHRFARRLPTGRCLERPAALPDQANRIRPHRGRSFGRLCSDRRLHDEVGRVERRRCRNRSRRGEFRECGDQSRERRTDSS